MQYTYQTDPYQNTSQTGDWPFEVTVFTLDPTALEWTAFIPLATDSQIHFLRQRRSNPTRLQVPYVVHVLIAT